ncbi:hypothetical protein SAMN05660337_0435 [Maridesulfovibrio ferrireducens]|uniref:Uncharacterized protein n=1 Tax=Maridesulfovibrio ferrireducens TaxID=246191 RepID=A0A1G9BW36_9BACT|nr:hypothetical protein [Maridesulfovibrio ferrireducens]SDK43374.1 hypothetical protein SAMN05660337_0435 [Maridesulfovibrio ferrireducens]
MGDRYYKPIFEGHFDAAKKGERLSIPINFKYKTEYDLLISIPKDDIKSFYSEKGTLNYKFTSKGKILEKGTTLSPSNTVSYSASINGPLSAVLLTFNLPFPGAGDDLVLVIEAINPLTALNKYSGSILCTVEPSLMK